MDERIRTILEYAVMAPSGDNCQPWQLAVDGWQGYFPSTTARCLGFPLSTGTFRADPLE